VHLGGKLAPDTDDCRVMRAKVEALLAEIPSRARWAAPGTAVLPAVDVR
jgi:hypothetical protein